MQISKIDQEEQFLTVLCGKGFNITKSPKYDEYQWGLASMVYKFFDKKIENGVFFINIYSKYERVVPLKNKKKVLQLLRLFKNFWMNQAANQTKYG